MGRSGAHRLSSWGLWAQLLCRLWDLGSQTRNQTLCLALQGTFLTTGHQGSPFLYYLQVEHFNVLVSFFFSSKLFCFLKWVFPDLKYAELLRLFFAWSITLSLFVCTMYIILKNEEAFFFSLLFSFWARSISVLQPGVEPGSWQWNPRILTTRPLGNSQGNIFRHVWNPDKDLKNLLKISGSVSFISSGIFLASKS